MDREQSIPDMAQCNIHNGTGMVNFGGSQVSQHTHTHTYIYIHIHVLNILLFCSIFQKFSLADKNKAPCTSHVLMHCRKVHTHFNALSPDVHTARPHPPTMTSINTTSKYCLDSTQRTSCTERSTSSQQLCQTKSTPEDDGKMDILSTGGINQSKLEPVSFVVHVTVNGQWHRVMLHMHTYIICLLT